MSTPNELHESRSRAKVRKLFWELAAICIVLAVCYEATAVLGRRPIPFVICLAAAGVFAIIGFALPDGRPPSDEMRDYEEGRRGSIEDGRDSR